MEDIQKLSFTVLKHARKWSRIAIHKPGRGDWITKVLRESVEGVPEGETLQRYGRIECSVSGGYRSYSVALLSEDEGRAYAETEKQSRIAALWARFLEGCEKGYYPDKVVAALHEAGFHDKDAEIEQCRKALDQRESAYSSFRFDAYDGFHGRPKKGSLFVLDGKAYEVVSSYYHAEDGLSFGVMTDAWYSVRARDISDTERGARFLADHLADKRRDEQLASAGTRVKAAQPALEDRIRTDGQRYRGAELPLSCLIGEDVLDTFDVYGGGEIVRVCGDTTWLIINNGRDGDRWDINNIQTGGAGAYAYFLDSDSVAALVDDYSAAAKALNDIKEATHHD